MSPLRYVYLVCLAAAVMCAPPSHAQQPLSPVANKAAADLVDKALAQMTKLEQVRADLWQQVNTGTKKLEGTGRFLCDPKGRKVAYQMKVEVGGVTGVQETVSDGKTMWRREQIGDQSTVRKYELAALDKALPAPEKASDEDDVDRQIRQDLQAEQGFAGLRPVLRELRNRLIFTAMKKEELTAADGKTKIAGTWVDGEWNRETLEEIAPKTRIAPDGKTFAELWDKRLPPFDRVPRRCRIFLTAEDATGAPPLWPYRIEWHGPARPEAKPDDEVLLVVIEFRPITTPASDGDFILKLTEAEAQRVKTVDPAELIKRRRAALEERARRLPPTIDPTGGARP